MASSPDREPATSPAATAAARDLVVLFRRLRTRMRAVPTEGLTPSQTSVLIRLGKDGASSTTVLAAAEGVRPQSMTVILNALDAQGLIERRPDPEDGRRQIITLSAAGQAQVASGRQGRHAWLAQELDRELTADQLARINDAIALLRRVVGE
ncbi:MarR family transcriptional regulator [Actinocatenispora thailandica]|uniref:MarR family transcriptional regulator n=1 Tax=Actinocatenispora thailandica TaxID=227318 RepID=A0A7R7DKJ3_9ACTN|nr:MarR family transcriptional regulator [Actinocatenispora thailandica]BCJ33445.1 MarR family transcriptional regulator [Actinocatenispora thailandica]